MRCCWGEKKYINHIHVWRLKFVILSWNKNTSQKVGRGVIQQSWNTFFPVLAGRCYINCQLSVFQQITSWKTFLCTDKDSISFTLKVGGTVPFSSTREWIDDDWISIFGLNLVVRKTFLERLQQTGAAAFSWTAEADEMVNNPFPDSIQLVRHNSPSLRKPWIQRLGLCWTSCTEPSDSFLDFQMLQLFRSPQNLSEAPKQNSTSLSTGNGVSR